MFLVEHLPPDAQFLGLVAIFIYRHYMQQERVNSHNLFLYAGGFVFVFFYMGAPPIRAWQLIQERLAAPPFSSISLTTAVAPRLPA